jgi:hypothetical protein
MRSSQLGTLLAKITLIFYRFFLSPLLGPTCRFYPSCSVYTYEAIEKYGTGKGLCLAALRLAKCHPWHPGGFDPIPEPSKIS